MRLSPPSVCALGGTAPAVIDGGGEGEGATAARNRRRRGARALAKEEEPEPGEDWEGEERPEEYAGLFDDP